MPPIFICASKEGRKKDVVWSQDLSSSLRIRNRVTFGRNSSSCDFGLEHASLSRVHAEISIDDNGSYFVCDLGSTHGTFLNGERLDAHKKTPLRIDSNDYVVFGASTRKYYLSSTDDIINHEMHNDDLGHGKVSTETTVRSEVSERGKRDDSELRAAIASFSAPIVSSAIRHPQIHDQNIRDNLGSKDNFVNDDDVDGGYGFVDVDEENNEKTEPQELSDLPVAFGARQTMQQSSIGKKRPRTSSDDNNNILGAQTNVFAEKSHTENHSNNRPEDRVDAVIAQYQLPISHAVSLRGHDKAVTCIAFDPSGSRIATASSDCSLRFYNFAGMDASQSAFRVITPQEGQGVRSVRSVSYSNNGDRIVVATTSAHASVFDRDSKPLVKTVKGDPYIADVSNTRGHTAALSHVQFHPLYRDTLVTSSLDGTVRLWDLAGGKLAFNELICGDILKFKNSKGQRAGVTAASVSPDGKSVIAGTDDGALHLVHMRQPTNGSSSGITGHKYARTDALVRDSIVSRTSGGISCVVFSPDGVRFATRHITDDRLKIWDLRKFSGEKSTPLASLSSLSGNLETDGDTANCAWSPDGKSLIAGISGREKTLQHPGRSSISAVMSSAFPNSSGRVLFFDIASLESSSSSLSSIADESSSSSSRAYYQASIEGGSSAVCVNWNAKINQIAVGCGDGITRILYNPTLSTAGALLSSSRAPKRITVDDWAASAASEASGILAIVPGEAQGGKKLTKQQQHQQQAEHEASQIQPRKVDKSSLLDSGKRTFTEHFLAVSVKGSLREEDPQAVLQRYATTSNGGGGGGGASFTSAYRLTQPVTLLAEKTAEEEIDEIEAAKAARRNKT